MQDSVRARGRAAASAFVDAPLSRRRPLPSRPSQDPATAAREAARCGRVRARRRSLRSGGGGRSSSNRRRSRRRRTVSGACVSSEQRCARARARCSRPASRITMNCPIGRSPSNVVGRLPSKTRPLGLSSIADLALRSIGCRTRGRICIRPTRNEHWRASAARSRSVGRPSEKTPPSPERHCRALLGPRLLRDNKIMEHL